MRGLRTQVKRRGQPELPPPPLVAPSTVRRLRLDVGRRVDGILLGDNLGYLPGAGSEPDQARPYTVGDDVRHMDWAVTARTTEPHVRTTVAERELETTLVLDLSPSMSFGSSVAEKRDVALALCAAVLHLANGPGDRVGALVVHDGRVNRLPYRTGSQGSLALLATLLRAPRSEPVAAGAPSQASTGSAQDPGATLGTALRHAYARPRQRGLVVVVSDLLDSVDTWERPLRVLTQHHDVMVLQVLDRRERELPEGGVLRLLDPETGDVVDVRATRATRERYAAASAERTATARRAVIGAGAAHGVIQTEEDWLPQLARFLDTRRRTRGALPGGGRRHLQ